MKLPYWNSCEEFEGDMFRGEGSVKERARRRCGEVADHGRVPRRLADHEG